MQFKNARMQIQNTKGMKFTEVCKCGSTGFIEIAMDEYSMEELGELAGAGGLWVPLVDDMPFLNKEDDSANGTNGSA